MYAVCCEFSDGIMTFSNQIFCDMHANNLFFNLQNVSFLCNCGGLAIIVAKIRCYNMVFHIQCKHGLIYTMRYDANLRMYPDT